MGFWTRLKHTLRPEPVDADIAAEIDHHLALRQRDSPRTRFGSPERARERAHDFEVLTWLESWLQDLRHAARMLRRSPAFTLIVVVSLALGIGANAAIFSLVNAVLLKTLPVPNPQQIVLLGQHGDNNALPLLSYPVVEHIATSGRAAGVEVGAASSTRSYPLGAGNDSSAMADLQLVTGGYFPGLHLTPALGRWINKRDNRAIGASPVAVVSYAFWQKQFGGRRNVIGHTLHLRNTALTIIGVAPPGFSGLDPANPASIWAPVMMQSVLHVSGNAMNVNGDDHKPWPPQEQISWLQAFARLPHPHQEARLQAAWNRLLRQSWKRVAPDATPMTLTMAAGARGSSRLRGQFGTPLRMIMALAGLMLLTAIANVAALLLARTIRRRREIAIRLAIGVSHPRLTRQLITEGIVLAAIAGAASVALALWLSRFLVQLAGAGNGPPFRPDLNWRVWLLLAAVALATGVVLGILPAWQARHGNPASDLKAQAGQVAAERVPLGRWLIIAQVALALLLVAGAGLFARSLASMFHVNLGFQPAHLLAVDLSLPPGTQLAHPAAVALEQNLLQHARALPGITAAALSENGIETDSMQISGVVFPGHVNPKSKPRSQEDAISRSFFATAAMPLLRGRGFDAADTARSTAVVVVNQAFVQAHFPGRDPIGQTFGYSRENLHQFTIVGVVADARINDPHTPASPLFFHFAGQAADAVPLR
ncbi:MAG: ABC transporter permease, partial [Terriglobales bacterium]